MQFLLIQLSRFYKIQALAAFAYFKREVYTTITFSNFFIYRFKNLNKLIKMHLFFMKLRAQKSFFKISEFRKFNLYEFQYPRNHHEIYIFLFKLTN